MAQIADMLQRFSRGEFTEHDFILFEDMFHPGIEALGYAFDQLRYSKKEEASIPRIGMRCLAQTIDPDDFVHYTGVARWMRHYEKMANEIADCLFAASTEMVAHMQIANWAIPTFVTGLPFCIAEVLDHIEELTRWSQRKDKVVFASRIADEKQPNFLGAVAMSLKHKMPNVEFMVCSGTAITNTSSWPLFHKAIARGALTIKTNLSKDQYYRELNSARVLFNCSLQDWVSNTASEADTLGCNLVFPAYRSFPEAFHNDPTRLYVPWSLKDAVDKLVHALNIKSPVAGQFSWEQNLTNKRTYSVIKKFMKYDSSEYYIPNVGCRKNLVPVHDLEQQMLKIAMEEKS
jgi:hypothetical protein